MAGYHNYSMSNNAIEAYQNGLMPLSKWTKKSILDALKESEKFNENDLDWLKKQSVKWLKENCLTCSEWHHTSKFYNQTNFYEIKENFNSNSIIWEVNFRAWKVKTEHFFNENLDKVITLIDSKGVKHERCKLVRSWYFWAMDLDTNEKFHFDENNY